MIGWIIFWVAVVLLALEILSLWETPKSVLLHCECDMSLVEPKEQVTITYEVRNNSRIPVAFAGVSLGFDEKINVLESREWKQHHLTEDWNGVFIGNNFMLLPHRRFIGRLHVSFDTRGIHHIDRIYLETGDLFGFKTRVNPVSSDISIICTSGIHEGDEAMITLGGIIGDISIRRFIFEDPSILSGYNEYTGREPMKQISWLKTAEQGKLMVKQNDYTVDACVSVLVDLSGKDKQLLEEVLVLTRTVCEELEAKSVPYELVSNGDLRSIPEGFGKNHLHLILKRIGGSKLASYTDFADIIEDGVRRIKNNRSYIVISGNPIETTLLERLKLRADGRVDEFVARDILDAQEVSA